MLHSKILLLVVALLAIPVSCTVAQQQEDSQVASSLTIAKEISAATGRPIFAVAGRST